MFSGLFKDKIIKSDELTLEDLKAREPQYEGLKGVRYSHGGGMEGSSHSVELKTDEDGKILVIYSDRSDPGTADRVRVYEGNNDHIFEELDEIVNEYNLSVWDDLPEPEEFALDAPSTALTLYFVPQKGDKYMSSMTIDYDDVFPKDGYEVLNSFMKKIYECGQDGVLIETYLEDYNGNRIYTGKEIENSEEEMMELIKGSWGNGNASVYIYFNDEPETINFRSDERKEYTLKEIVHEPLDDNDCSWYKVYANKEDEEDLLYLTMNGYQLYAKDGYGNSQLLESY